MGRTNPTFRDLISRFESRWQPFRRTLRHEDQARFDRLLAHARRHADAGGALNHESPVVPLLVAVTLAQERRIDELEARIEDDDSGD
ncbi:hypothetical protein GJ629_03555 [Halapricum sp. CBA1109]|uniref:hypothetical protein n=1 Tax=Halapricum sp. CBA1109 TaxID=2668068 RepID=UPI0012F73CD0|nr:hypothetical protein [Halapricum sp. CBA1109]MUV89090.1 hypothetical protein [Halapricum sp. CBA1109]